MEVEDFKELRENSLGWISGGCDSEYCTKEWDRILAKILLIKQGGK